MEVTVVKMRRNGEKLSPEELERAARVHGFMEIKYWILNNGKEPRRKVKELILKSSPTATSQPALTLTDPEQTQLKDDDMVYIGTETENGQPYLQSWWVKHDPRPVGNGVVPYEYPGAGKRASV